ncbi:Ataxin-10 [Geodia barretti]|nr:Ataxin-10 [Geodia barretti]
MMIVKLLSDWSEIYSSKSTPETPPKPGDPALLSLIKLLLNSCAGVPCNQHYLLEAGALAEISKLLLQFVTSHQQMPISTGDHRDVVVTATLQLLGNICVGFRDGRDKVWRKFFPQTLRSILRSFGQVEMVCMVLHNCTCTEDAKNRTREMVTSEGGLAILSHIVGAHEEKNCEWRSIFLRSFVDQMPLSELHRVLIPFQYGLWTALLETACQLMNHDQQIEVGGGKEAWPQWEEGECVYLVEMWRGEVGKVMSDQAAILIECFNTSSTEQLSSTAKMNVGVLTSVLKLLCCLSIRERYLHLLQTKTQTLDSAIELLRQLSTLDGSNNSTRHLSSLKESRKTTEIRKEGPLFGMKRDLLQFIGSLLYHCPHMQERIRMLEAIPLILNQCHLDHGNPYILQWAVLTIRNMCEDNPANQEMIAKLETRGVAEATAAQFRPGCEVEVTQNGRLRVKPKT